MAILKKNKRKFIIEDEVFFWFVNEADGYSGSPELMIIREDKKVIVTYSLFQRKDRTMTRLNFSNTNNYPKLHGSFKSPIWENKNGIITPQTIGDIILWCKRDKNIFQEVNCL